MNGWVAWQITQRRLGLVWILFTLEVTAAQQITVTKTTIAQVLAALLRCVLSDRPLFWFYSLSSFWSGVVGQIPSVFCELTLEAYLSANPREAVLPRIPLLTLSGYLGWRNCIRDIIVNWFTIVAFSKHVTVYLSIIFGTGAAICTAVVVVQCNGRG
jgi:hypothetical protein